MDGDRLFPTKRIRSKENIKKLKMLRDIPLSNWPKFKGKSPSTKELHLSKHRLRDNNKRKDLRSPIWSLKASKLSWNNLVLIKSMLILRKILSNMSTLLTLQLLMLEIKPIKRYHSLVPLPEPLMWWGNMINNLTLWIYKNNQHSSSETLTNNSSKETYKIYKCFVVRVLSICCAPSSK